MLVKSESKNQSDIFLPDEQFLISIIIPSYNYGRFLNRAVGSVVDQCGIDVEIIIIDDGSTDNTGKISKQLIKENPKANIRYFYQTNSGLASSRNKGISLSKGQYIIFLDSDDALVPGGLDRVRETLSAQTDNINMLIFGYISIEEKNGSEKVRMPDKIYEDNKINFIHYLFKKLSISNGASVLNKKVFKEIKYDPNLINAEDIPVFSLILANFSCKTVNMPLAKIYKWPDSLRNKFDENVDQRSDIVDAIFTSPMLPKEMLSYQKPYAAYRCMSAFRKHYRQQQYIKARSFFMKAAGLNFPSILDIKQLLCFFRCFLK